MKLLFDENLSISIVEEFRSIFPNSAHVVELGLKSASDETIWNYARSHDFAIVTKCHSN